MRFAQPEWLALIPLLIAAGWYWRRLGLLRPVRGILLLILVICLAQPQLQRIRKGLDLWVLVDRSASAAEHLATREAEWERLLEKSQGRHDRLRFVDYAGDAIERSDADGTVFQGDRRSTKTADAVYFSLSRMASDRAARVLLLSDGYATESLGDLAERLLAQQVPMDYRIIADEGGADPRIQSMCTPARAQPNEPFLISAVVSGVTTPDIAWTLNRDGQPLHQGKTASVDGVAHIRLTDRLASPGAFKYEISILPDVDAQPGNNHASAWIEIDSGPRVLLVTRYPDDPVAAALRRQGFSVTIVTNPKTLTVGALSGLRTVMIHNLPAHQIPQQFLDGLDLFVRVQGGGFAMIGGNHSFGSGGYFASSVDPLLPISMELREDHRKLAVAMAIVMDRSGSMGATVGNATKMDLANDGAARSIELLGANDLVTVFAVDSSDHVIIPLTQVGPNRAQLIEACRKVQSMGGGIYVYTGLKAAWNQLKTAQVGQRHIILFSDAADSEEPGDYKDLIKEMTANGTTVSVIGLGDDTDTDADFLKDIAKRGNGRMFFNSNAADIPAIFAQETVTVARSAFIEDPIGVKSLADWHEIAPRQLNWLPKVDGYNLSYLRPEASAAAISTDEYSAPLVAWWQRGIGRTMAISFPLGGEFSQSARAWPQYEDFVQTSTRWLIGETLPPGIGLKSRVDGTELHMELLYDDTWSQKVAKNPPKLLVADGKDGSITELPWERLEPGRSRAILPLPDGTWLRGAVNIGSHAIPFGPVASGINPEWAVNPDRIRELKTVSALSGGQERLDMSTVWQAPTRRAFTDFRTPLLILAMLLFLFEAFATRTGYKLPALSRFTGRIKMPTQRQASAPAPRPKETTSDEKPPTAAVSSTAEKPADSAIDEPTAEASRENRQSRFERAKRRK